MKWMRIIGLVTATLGLLALVLYWSQQPRGFATPAACLDAYREASRAGDMDTYWSCLAEPLRSNLQRQHPNPKELADSLRQDMIGVKTWVQADSVSAGPTTQVDVDEGRVDGSRRIRFRLQRSGTGWLIAGIDQPKVVPAGIPYGTHVSQVAQSAESKSP